MAKQLFANNATSTITSTILATDLSLTLYPGTGSLFPSPIGGDYFLVTLYDTLSTVEIVKCTGRTLDTLTIVRGQEGTVASSFPSGSLVEVRATRDTYNNLAQKTGDTIADITITTLTTGTHTSTTSHITTADVVNLTVDNLTLNNPLEVSEGGTNATTASGARTNLGLAIGTDVQAHSTILDAVAALTPADSAFIVGDGSTFVTESGATARTSLGLGSAATMTGPGSAIVGISDTQTLTNKTYDLTDNTLNGTLAEFNAACSDADFVSIGGTESITNKTLIGVKEKHLTVSGIDLDLSLANYFTKTVSGATSLSVSNVGSADYVSSFILKLINGGSSAVTYWSGVKWEAGSAPTLTVSGVDILGFFSVDGGTTWYGVVLALDAK